VPDQVETVRTRFGLTQVVLVGDRGMLTQTRIDALSTRCQHTCRLRSDATSTPVQQITPATPLQARALARVAQGVARTRQPCVPYLPTVQDDRGFTRRNFGLTDGGSGSGDGQSHPTRNPAGSERSRVALALFSRVLLLTGCLCFVCA
jgi:hypothetical protein